MDSLIAKKYCLLNEIGSGSFGVLYRAFNIHTQEDVVLKMELINSEMKLLKNETKIYQYLWNDLSMKEGIPKVYWFGISGNNYSMSMELLGPSLSSSNHTQFTLKEISSIAVQIVKRIQFVHSRDIIHRDIKPDNFLFKGDILYIIDFGLSRMYKKKGVHISENIEKRKNIIGTPNYVSIRVLEGSEPTRRDDLESVVYIMYYLWKKTISIKDKYKFTEATREKYDMPKYITDFFDICRQMRFDEEPNYDLLYSILYDGLIIV